MKGMGGYPELVVPMLTQSVPKHYRSSLLNLSVPAPPISAPVLWDHYQLLQGSLGPCLHLPLPPEMATGPATRGLSKRVILSLDYIIKPRLLREVATAGHD